MKTWIIIGALLISILPATAEEQKPYHLDLQSAIRMALEQNSSLKSVKEGESIAQARLGQAKASDAVRINVNAGYNRVDKPTLFGGMTILDENTNLNVISLSKPVYTGGASQAAREQAKWGAAAAEEQTHAAQEDMVMAVTENYIRALEAREGLRVADDAVSFLEANLDSANKLKDAGTAPKSDVFRAETELASAREKRIQAQTAYKIQLAVLRNLLNIEPDSELKLADTLPSAIPEVGTELVSNVPSTPRPEIRAMEDSVKIAEMGIKRAKASTKPVVDMNADFLNIGTGAEFPRLNNTFSAGIRISMPLSDGGSTKANVNEAKASLRKAMNDLDTIKRRMELEKEQAALTLENAEARVLSTGAHLRSAQESVRVLKVSYQEDIAPITDVLGARAALTEADSARVSSLYDRYIAQVRLLKANGKIMSIVSP